VAGRSLRGIPVDQPAFGHTLVVPIEEVDHWIDASPALTAHLFEVTRRIARAQQAAFSPTRVGVIIAGYEVPHAHIHVIPTDDMSQLSFANAAPAVSPGELQRAADMITGALDAG
jgi:histidine triad (HIT) family protein